METYEGEQAAIFIDGVHLHAMARALGFSVDFRRLLTFFQQRTHLLRAHYYTPVSDDKEFTPLRSLLDWLDYNEYCVVTKPTKEFTDLSGRRKIKGSISLELVVDALRLSGAVDHIVLFLGDGDFRCLVVALQQKGTRVTVISTLETQPPLVSDELRRQADQFVDIVELIPAICRNSGDGSSLRRNDRT